MHIAIVGAGSVGSFLGATMTRSGRRVTLIDQWPEHIEAIKKNGVRVEGTSGDFVVPVTALHIHEVQRLINDPVDVALVCVKSYDTEWSTALIRDYLAPSGVVVSLQNSFNEEAMARIVGYNRVLGCVLNTIGVEVREPGTVVRWYQPSTPDYAVFRIGEMHGRITPRARAIAEALATADVAKVTTNLWGERWSKLTINSMGSATGAVTGIGLVQMYRDAGPRRLSMRLGQEAIAVGTAMGFELESICGATPDQWRASMTDAAAARHLDAVLAVWADRIRADGQVSTLHDWKRGRRMEAESINGLVVRKATEVGVEVPYQAAMTELVRKLERGEIEQGIAAIGPLIGN